MSHPDRQYTGTWQRLLRVLTVRKLLCRTRHGQIDVSSFAVVVGNLPRLERPLYLMSGEEPCASQCGQTAQIYDRADALAVKQEEVLDGGEATGQPRRHPDVERGYINVGILDVARHARKIESNQHLRLARFADVCALVHTLSCDRRCSNEFARHAHTVSLSGPAARTTCVYSKITSRLPPLQGMRRLYDVRIT